MVDQIINIHGIRFPTFFYGTAWKEDDTTKLTLMAIDTGFRGIDTANQRRHYFEAGVGKALAGAFEAGNLKREALFLQTKFTFVSGQDHRLPYDKGAPIATQVEQSFASSLENLGTDYLDSYVLHGPSRRYGLGPDDWQAWEAMEALHRSSKTRLLGVSNISIDQLEELYDKASVKPAIVQNRCFASQGWDRSVRSFCREHGVVYQGFSLLTANSEFMRHHQVKAIADRLGKAVTQVVFRFALQVGMVALTGTTSADHMADDLAVYNFELQEAETEMLESLVG